MPQTCSICIHPDRVEINRALATKEPLRHVAIKFGTSASALQRHKPHIPRLLAKAATLQEKRDLAEGQALAEHLQGEEKQEVSRADDLLKYIDGLCDRQDRLYKVAEVILARAVKADDPRLALAAIQQATNANREAKGISELLAELVGELNRNPQVNILLSPQWVTIRAVIVDALREFPTARAVVAERLLQLEGQTA